MPTDPTSATPASYDDANSATGTGNRDQESMMMNVDENTNNDNNNDGGGGGAGDDSNIPPTHENANGEDDDDDDEDSDDSSDSDSDSDSDDDEVIIKHADRGGGVISGHVFDDEDDDDMYHDEPDAFTSIWDMVGTYAQSPLEQMLSKDNVDHVTLESVLDEDTLIQELKASNAKVIDFLAKPKHVSKILHYLTTEHYREDMTEEDLQQEQVDIEDGEENEQTLRVFKYPFVSSEVICCDVDAITEAIISSEEFVMTLFSYLSNRQQNKTSQNPSLSLYFTKALSTLLQKNFIKIADVLMRKHSDDFNVIENILIKNIGLCDMDIMVLKLLGFETHDDGFDQDVFGGFVTQQRIMMMKQRMNDKELKEKKILMQQWAVDHGLIESMIDKLEQNIHDEDLHHNIFNIFCDVLEKGKNPLSTKLFSTETVQRLVDLIVKHNQTSIFAIGVPYLRVLCDHGEPFEETPEDKPPAYLLAMHTRTKDFVDLLHLDSTDADSTPQIELTIGTLSPPLGETRLRAVEHLQLLFRTRFENEIHKDLIEFNALQRVLDLFFRFEFNNMLHYVVFGIVQNILEGENMRLKELLFVDCQFIQRMLQAFEESEQAVKEPKGMRKGHIGYIVELVNLIRRLSYNEDTSVEKLTKGIEGWKEFLEGSLEQINSINERELGGPIPIGSAFQQHHQPMSFQYDDDDSDDEHYNYDDSDDDSDDDDVVVKKHVPQESTQMEEEEEGQQPDSATGSPDFDTDFDSNF